ncbi:hypothetical protein, partial [Pantoea piersonii]|uniref:hypothetical protein n=1 Tax=Pantoea piersonii TaxID=2364647 RepID=UPI002899B2D6
SQARDRIALLLSVIPLTANQSGFYQEWRAALCRKRPPDVSGKANGQIRFFTSEEQFRRHGPHDFPQSRTLSSYGLDFGGRWA